ncbi:MAG: MFS transporter [Pseudomonadota bacterium]
MINTANQVRASHRSDKNNVLLRIAILYVVQGVPLGLGFEAVPTLLREAGTSLSILAWAPMVGIPWVLKLLWATAVDNYWSQKLGKRRTWILPSQLLLMIGFVCLAFVPFIPDNATLIIVIVGVLSVAGATQDIATDGYAAEILPPENMGLANSFQVGGMAIGLLIGGAGVMIASSLMSTNTALLLLACLVSLSCLTMLRWKDRSGDYDRINNRAKLTRFLSRPSAISVLSLGLVATLTGVVLQSLWRLVLVDLNWDTAKIGSYSALMNTGAMMLAAMLAVPLMKNFGVKNTGISGMLLTIFAGILWMLIATMVINPEWYVIGTLIGVGSIGTGLASVVVFAVIMRFAKEGDQAGTDFTIFQSSHVFGAILLPSVAIGISSQLGYSAGFGFGIAISMLSVATFILIDQRILDVGQTEPEDEN